MNRSVLYALLAAALFGASTPFAKLLVGHLQPMLLAGLLYLGSGLGLFVLRLARDRGWKSSHLSRTEWPWLLGAILFGGVLGPVALMFGLMTTSGSVASLLLNLEAEPQLGIRRSLKPIALPREALDYLSPRPRTAYFFEPARELEAELTG